MSATATDGVGPPPCWNCGKPLDELLLPASRHEYCPHCAEAVHCCRSCVLFAPSRPEQCAEDRAEPPTDKTAANFCDFFSLGSEAAASAGGSADAEARARLDALFAGSGDAPAPAGELDGAAGRRDGADHDSREQRARARLDDLFGGGTESD